MLQALEWLSTFIVDCAVQQNISGTTGTSIQHLRFDKPNRQFSVKSPGFEGNIVTRLGFCVAQMKVFHRLHDIAGFCFTTMLLFAYAPLIGFIALAIYIDSVGPVFLKRTLKVDGRPDVESFVFRTARLSGDCRPTAFGTFLRNSSLDRLPQLLTILWGGKPLRICHATPH
jgi:lipopolysaccharide/colanic/teichoic acid biosynthesis glycosyltransferase